MFGFVKLALLAAMAVSSGFCGEDEEIKAALAAASPANRNPAKPKKWSEDIATWQAPKEMAVELPYYIAGYDYEDRPEMGKWDTRKYTDAGSEKTNAYNKYVEQFWWRVSNTTSAVPDAEEGVTLIIDCSGFTNRQMTSVAAIQSHLIAASFSAWAEKNVANFILINVNFAIRTWINILRSISGPLAGRAELYGTRSETWKPELRRRIPADQLPPWYGGSQKFKPLQIFA